MVLSSKVQMDANILLVHVEVLKKLFAMYVWLCTLMKNGRADLMTSIVDL